MIITLEKIITVIVYELITILLSIVYILIIMGLMKNKLLNRYVHQGVALESLNRIY